MRELTQQERIDIVRYRIENAHLTLDEVSSHIEMGYYNTAVNRMYYACYYAVGALLITKEVVTKSHDGVRQMFNLHYVQTGIVQKEMGHYFIHIFEACFKGDFEDFFNNDLTTCNELYPQAKEFVAVLTDLAEAWLREQE